MLNIKRIYEKKAAADGRRIYVDRLWARVLTKKKAGIDDWLKDLGPSDRLRKRFGHEPERFPEFRRDYIKELAASEKAALLQRVAVMAGERDVTLVYSARDTKHNNAIVLAELIGKLMRKKAQAG